MPYCGWNPYRIHCGRERIPIYATLSLWGVRALLIPSSRVDCGEWGGGGLWLSHVDLRWEKWSGCVGGEGVGGCSCVGFYSVIAYNYV